jgi:transposase, IS6 family
MRRHLRPCRGPWYVDETYIRVSGQWRYLYRAVDGTGQSIDFLLSAKRDKKAAKRFFKRALGREHTRAETPCGVSLTKRSIAVRVRPPGN